MITPAIKAIKRANPDLKITLLVTDSSYEVFRTNADIERFLFFRKGRGLFALISDLARTDFCASLIFHASDRLVWLLAAAASRATFAGDWQSVSVPQGLVDKWHHTPDREHRIISHLHTAKLIASNIDTSATDMSFNVDPGALRTVQNWLWADNDEPAPRDLVGIFPGAKDRFKCWSIDNFAEVGRALEQHGMQIVIIGGGEDDDLVDALSGRLNEPLVFKESIQDLAALLSQLLCLVTNDSGPMHLALAVDTPVIGLFGPTDALETGPLTSRSRYLTIDKSVTCYPSTLFPISQTQCFNKQCRNPICINQISVAEVLEKVSLVRNSKI